MAPDSETEKSPPHTNHRKGLDCDADTATTRRKSGDTTTRPSETGIRKNRPPLKRHPLAAKTPHRSERLAPSPQPTQSGILAPALADVPTTQTADWESA